MRMPDKEEEIGRVYFNSDSQLYSHDFADIYFSASGAQEEAEHVFIAGSNLKERFRAGGRFVIAEAGFGTGLNFLQTMAEWVQHFAPSRELVYIGFELFPLSPALLEQVYRLWPDLGEYSRYFLQMCNEDYAESGMECWLERYNVRLVLHIGDINTEIENLGELVDAWFLDGFSPAKNPQMWSERVFQGMRRFSKKGSTFATYSCARAVREGLQMCGFDVRKIPGFGRKKHMLCGTFMD